MKRVERRGALESTSASQHALLAHRSSISHHSQPSFAHSPHSPHPQHAPSTHAHSHSSHVHTHALPRPHAQDAVPAHHTDHGNRARAASRQDTLIIDARDRDQDRDREQVPQPVHERTSYYRDAESDRDSRADSRRSLSPVPPRYRDHREPLTVDSVTRDRRAGHYADEHDSPDRSRVQPQQSSTLQLHPGSGSHRRPPTPPYITSISSHDQFANGTHARPALSATRSAPRQGSRDSTEEFLDGDGDEDGDEEDGDVDSVIAHAADASKLLSRAHANGVALPRVATLDERSSSSRWNLANSHSRHEREREMSRAENHSRDQDQDELDSDMDGDVEVDASASLSHSGSRPRSADGAKDDEADGGADADVDIMDAVDAAMKTED